MLTRGLILLNAFGHGEVETSQAELARRTQLPKPTAHRLIRELVDFGALERTEKGVRLGSWLYLLGRSVYQVALLRATAQVHLDQLHEFAHVHACLSVLLDGEVVDVASAGPAPWRGFAENLSNHTMSSAATQALRVRDLGEPVVVTAPFGERIPRGHRATAEQTRELTSIAQVVRVPDTIAVAMSIVGPAELVPRERGISHLRRSCSDFSRRLAMVTLADPFAGRAAI